MTMLRPLTLFQWGKETTRGTLVAATSKIAVENIEFTEEDEMYRPNLAKGLIMPHSGNETPIQRGTKWSVKDQPVVYEQLQHWLSMAVKGGVSATGVGDPYTWTFTRSITADPVPNTFTLERRLTDGTNHVDLEWGYAFLTSLSFMFEVGQPLKFSAEGVARRVQSSTMTAALSMPTILIPPAPLGKLWLDAAWGNLGTTLISGQLRKATFTFKTGLKPVMLMDGRTDLDFSSYLVDGNEVGMDLSLEVLLTKAQFDAQKTAAEAGTLRAVRLKIEGPTADRSLQIDGLFKFEKASFFEVGDQDGQVAGTFTMKESTDGTNLLSIIAINSGNVYT